jgi:protein transport protein SEC61 subunit gamma and related proteins
MVSKKFSKLLDDIIDKSWKLQERLEESFRGMGKGEYGRVIKMARKPEYDEYMKTCGITGIGIVVIGGMGFAIYYLWVHLPDWVGGWLGL